MTALTPTFSTSKQPSLLASLQCLDQPAQCDLRVVYGLGTGAGATGIRDNPLHSSFLALTREYEKGTAISQGTTLPQTILTTQPFKLPSDETFETATLDPTNQKTTGWFTKLSQLTESHNLPAIMLVPAFLVLDAIDVDIDGLIVYEH